MRVEYYEILNSRFALEHRYMLTISSTVRQRTSWYELMYSELCFRILRIGRYGDMFCDNSGSGCIVRQRAMYRE